MTIATPEAAAQTTAESHPTTPEHDCAYESSLKQEMGGRAISYHQVRSLEEQIARLHADGTCPPTAGPSLEWSDWVKTLKTAFH